MRYTDCGVEVLSNPTCLRMGGVSHPFGHQPILLIGLLDRPTKEESSVLIPRQHEHEEMIPASASRRTTIRAFGVVFLAVILRQKHRGG